MAEVDRNLPNKIERLAGVTVAMKKYVFEIEATADANLELARSESLSIGRRIDQDASVESNRTGNVTWVVELVDRGHNHGLTGTNAPQNIEFGRLPYVQRVNADGRFAGQLFGGMDGLAILTDAVKAVKNRHRRELRG